MVQGKSRNCAKAESRNKKELGDSRGCVLRAVLRQIHIQERPMDIVEATRLLLQQKVESREQKAADSALPNIHLLFVGSGELGEQLREQCDVVFDAEGLGQKQRAENREQKTEAEMLKVESRRQKSEIRNQKSSISHLPTASFAGFLNQSELPAAYTAADVLVLPSDGGETWGLVVNEAMACGLPAIVSDAVGCAPDLIEEGKTGFTHPMGDSAALAQCLMRLAEMRRHNIDFSTALSQKLIKYSVKAAVEGALEAAEKTMQLCS